MKYPLQSLFDKVSWLTTRSVPLSENNVNSFMQIINSSPDFSLYKVKFTGLTQDNSMFYYQVFNECLNNGPLVSLLKGVVPPNNVRDAVQYVSNDRSLELTQYCIDSIFASLNKYPQFKPYSVKLEGLQPETTQEYLPIFDELLNSPGLPQFVFDISGYIIPNEKDDK